MRVALTPLHGVGGEFAMDALVRAGLSDVHVVESQFAPDPDFPTVAFPNPEEPGAVDALLKLAADVDAEIAIALDPDADRCAIGVPTPDGWRMLSGDETGWLLGDYILSQIEPGPVSEATVVASTVVSSRMLAAIAKDHGARHVETLTGFKWLSRADVGLPGCTLVYAYEEAIGHCVDPGAVRDKDGISAAVLACDLVAALRNQGRTVLDALDDLARRHGVHTTTAVSRRVADADEAEAVMARLRATPPDRLAGFEVTVDRSAARAGQRRTDALVFSGGDDDNWVRVVVRPSGTEPKVKSYIEVRCATISDLESHASQGTTVQDELVARRAALLARPELPIPGVAETRHDVGDVVEPLVDGRGEQPQVRRHLLQCRNAFGCDDDADRRDVDGVAGMQQPDGVRHRAAGGQHRVQHHHRLRAQIVGQRLQIRCGLVGFLVAGHPDEPDAGLRDQRVGLIDHAQPGAQHRHQQRRIGQPDPVVSASGVRTETVSQAASRVASYTNIRVRSRSAARNAALSVRSSRRVVSRAAASG